MKDFKWLAILILCFSHVFLRAQDEQRPFIEEGKVWLVRVDGQYYSDLIRSYCLDGDTVIDGHPCKKLLMHDILPQGNSTYRGALREENGRVWRYVPEETAPVLLSIYRHNVSPYVAYYDSESESIQDKTFTIDSYYEHSPLVIGEYVDPQGEIGPVVVKSGTKLSIRIGAGGTAITDCFECEKGAVLIIK